MKLKNEVKLGVASVAALVSGTAAASAADVGPSGYDWEGFYAGLSAGVLFGELAWSNSNDYSLDNNFTPGVYAGYNHVLDNGLIIGAELAANFPDKGVKDNGQGSSDLGAYGFNYLIDGKFKVGTTLGANGQVLAYAFGGVSGGDMSANSNDNNYSAFGGNYGIGIDYGVTENLSVGIEVIGRTMNGYTDGSKLHTNGQASLRASFNF